MPLKQSSKPSSLSQGQSTVSVHADISLDFGHYVMLAFSKFSCPIRVVVESTARQEPIITKQKKSPRQRVGVSTRVISSSALDHFAPTLAEGTLVIKYICNVNNNLVVEVRITKYKKGIPIQVLKIMGIVIPYFTTIEKITLTECRISGYFIEELNEILARSSVTDVCLDGSQVDVSNYDVLLNQSKLRSLSLSRCNLCDDQCQAIFSKLHYGMPAEASLKTLNLSNNFITDKGSKCIGEALKSNRSLRYLNLSNNQLTDSGAEYILNSLKKFQLTDKDVQEKRRLHFNYLRERRNVLITRVSSDTNIAKVKRISTKGKCLTMKPKISARKNHNKKQEAEEINLTKSYFHPYGANFLTDDHRHCLGNMVLCYLNLAYNNLSYISLTRIQRVLSNQQPLVTPDQCGLLALVLEGNCMPAQCDAMVFINNLLHLRRIQVSQDRRKKTFTISDNSSVHSYRT